MKLRVRFLPQQLLFAAGCSVLLASGAIGQAPAAGQATFKVRGGTAGVQQGTVLGAGPKGVEIRIGAQTVTLPPAMFESFQMAPPPEYRAGFEALTAKDYAKALTLIKSVTDKFKGLPTDWAQYATGLLGDIYMAQEDFAKAEAAYNEFTRLYKNASSATSQVGLARIALAKKDLAGAKSRLEPILADALKQKNIAPANAIAVSQAFAVSGQIKEADGNLQGALEDYLRTVTLFYHDPAAVALAQEKADALRSRDKNNPLTVP
jgi:tetratricopeptide (TPR) repeat protein